MPKKFQLNDMMSPGDGVVRSNFKDALRDIYDRINSVMQNGTLALVWLEKAIWISVEDTDTGLSGPIYFYDARDIAVKYGLVDDGGKTINDDGQEPDGDLLVSIAVLCALNGGAEEYIKGLSVAA